MYANTKKQNLFSHSYLIAKIAVHIYQETFEHWKKNTDSWKSYLENSGVDDYSEQMNSINKLDKLSNYVFITALLHDIGKIDDNFQEYIKNASSKEINEENGSHIEEDKKFSFEEYPRHNEISWLLSEDIMNTMGKLLDNHVKFIVPYAIFWHHAKPLRKKENFNRYDKIKDTLLKNNQNLKQLKKNYVSKINHFFDYVKQKENKDIFLTLVDDDIFTENTRNTPQFKKISESYVVDSLYTIVRMCIVLADRYVSSLSTSEIEDKIQYKEYTLSHQEMIELKGIGERKSLISNLEMMIEDFDRKAQTNGSFLDRNNKQKIVAEKLDQDKVMILKGAAGSGKTKVMLQYALKRLNKLSEHEHQQIFIIAPKNIICQGLYEELKKEYCKHSCIEIYTGEFKKRFEGLDVNNKENEQDIEDSNLDADITVTTIDQILSILMSHKKTDILFKILNSILIFDEFHEFVDTPAILYLFREILFLKSIMKNVNTLLVSATPNPYLTNNFLELNKNSYVTLETFNEKDYLFKFQKIQDSSYKTMNFNENPMMKENTTDDVGNIYIFNSATKSQFSTLMNIKNDLPIINYHSRFSPYDKKIIFKQIMDGFSAKGKYPGTFNKESIIKSGPIIQASINITTKKMFTEMCSAEFWCQRLGRLNRFAYDGVAELTTVYPHDQKEKNIGINKVLLGFSQYHIAYAWLNFMMNKIDNKELKLKDIYVLYEDFHKTQEAKKAYEIEFKSIEDKAKKVMEQDFEPIEFKDGAKKSKKQKLASKSMRSDSYYVLPSVVSINKEFKSNKNKLIFLQDINNFKMDKNKEYPLIEVDKLMTLERKSISQSIGFFTNNMKNSNIRYVCDYLKNTYGSSIKNLKEQDFFRLAKQKQNPIIVSGVLDENNEQDLIYFNKENEYKIGLFKYSYFMLIEDILLNKNYTITIDESKEDDESE